MWLFIDFFQSTWTRGSYRFIFQIWPPFEFYRLLNFAITCFVSIFSNTTDPRSNLFFSYLNHHTACIDCPNCTFCRLFFVLEFYWLPKCIRKFLIQCVLLISSSQWVMSGLSIDFFQTWPPRKFYRLFKVKCRQASAVPVASISYVQSKSLLVCSTWSYQEDWKSRLRREKGSHTII